MSDYCAIFEGVESALIRVGSCNLPETQIQYNLDEFKDVEGKPFSDDDYYWILVYVIFYSGFRAATVNARLDVIRQHLPDYQRVAAYQEADVQRILADRDMIRNERKVRACIKNAQTFAQIVREHGSFGQYIDNFDAASSFESLLLLKEELQYLFRGLGEITTYHVLTDIGLPVVKPDRVICRIFRRLGLIEDERQLLKTVIQGRKIAQATGHPVRYVDIVFVAYGQQRSLEFGLESGICLKRNPRCSVCGVTGYCNYLAQGVPAR